MSNNILSVSRWRKKPVVIEAAEVTKENINAVCNWCNGQIKNDTTFFINTLEGVMYANVGDVVIKGIKGEFYPCKQDIFLNSYEPVHG